VKQLAGNSVSRIVDLSSNVGDANIFGLATNANTAWVSAWNGQLLEVNLQTANVQVVDTALSSDALFSLVYWKSQQSSRLNPEDASPETSIKC
jgi:hypothetical protein